MKKIKERKRIVSVGFLILSVVTILSGRPITTFAEPILPAPIESPAVSEDTEEMIVRLGGDSDEKENYGYIPYTGLLEAPVLEPAPGLDRAITFPTKLDPRKTTAVTSVKNQYQTGSCWAHATLAASESSLIKKGQTNNSIDLSEMHLVYFYYSQPQDPLGNISNDKLTFTPDTMASRMNLGGNAVLAVWHMASGSGPVLQSATPSITSSTHQDTSTRLNVSTRNNRQYYLKEAKITPFSYENRDAIKQLIMEYGGVAASYYCDQEWEKEAGDTISYYNPSICATNHAVEIVGWDDNYSVTNFLGTSYGYTPKYAGAWLCKNSWGTGSGRKDGFFWLSYDTTLINAECVAFSYENNTKYMNTYQYDGTKLGGYYSGGDQTFANVYTAKGNPGGYEVIDAVGLGVGANGSYHIKIYVNPVIKDGKLQSYDYVSETTDFDSVYQGYYTVPLDNPIYVNQGESFAVAVTVDGESKLFCSVKGTISAESGVCTEEDIRLPGQSYCISGNNWMDNQAKGTPRIKALTNPVAKSTTPVTITLSESKMLLKYFGSKGETRQLAATLTPQNAVGGVRYFSSDDSVATVSSSGLVTAVKSGTCTIYAKYIDGTTASCEVTIEDYRRLDMECELDGEPWDGVGHEFTARDSGGNIYENHAYVPLGEYSIYDNGEDTGIIISISTNAGGYSCTLKYLTYKFYNYDGSFLHSQVGLHSKIPEYKGVIPSRPDDAEYTYTFSGWTPYLSSGTQEYTAKYIQTAKPQRITIEVRKNSYIWNTADAPKIELVSATDSTQIYQNGEAAPAGKYYIIADGKKTKYSVTTTEKLEYLGSINYYTATFFSDKDGKLLQRKAYLPGDIPTYDGDIPTKASDGTYHYTFSGWSKAIEPMGTKAVEYTACYTKTYCDRYAKVSATLDGEVVDDRISLYEIDITGSATEYLGIYENGSMVPVGLYELYLDSASIGKYVVVSPGKDYSSSMKLFTVIFENEDHTVLQKNYIVSGDAVEYKGDIPKKAADNAYCYTFDKWSGDMTNITEAKTYTALYHKSALPQKVNIQCSLSSNEIPTEAAVDLSLHSIEDETGIYKNGDCVPVGDYEVYVNGRDVKHRITVRVGEAYEEILQFYLIRFVDEVSDQLLKEEYYMEGEVPAIEDVLYSYEDNDYCRYEILGWDAVFEEVSESKTYLFRGSATPIVRELQITCYLNDIVWDPAENSDGGMSSVPQIQAMHISTQQVFENHCDNLPVGEYEILVNSRNSGVIFEVKSDSGLCRCDLNFYTIAFEDDMGNVLQSQICLKNELPVFEGEVPYKENTEQVCYRFLGWDNEISNVVNKATYKAVFSQSPTIVSIKNGEEEQYFSDIEAALAFADTIDAPFFVLEKDINKLVLPFKREIRIDLNGHSILGDVCMTSPADAEREFAPKLYLTNSKSDIVSSVCGDVVIGDATTAFDGSYLYNGVKISGNVVAQSIDNYGYMNCVKSFTDTLTNYGEIHTVLCVEKDASLVNKTEAEIGTIKENYGSISNKGILQTIELHKGELQNTYDALKIQEDHPHKINFYDGVTLLNSFVVYAESGFVFPYVDISKSGYVFLGWALENDSTKIYQPGTSSGSIEADNVNYFAMWKKESVSQGTNTPQVPAKPEENKKPTDSESVEDKYEIAEEDLEEGFDYKGLAYVFVDGNVWVADSIKKDVKKITIPSTVTFKGKKFKVTGINEDAFYGFQKLKTVTIGSNVKVIDRYAFYGCEKLKTVKMGKNVTQIKANAFENCTALKKITIPSKVKEIGKKAFYKCSSLKTITIKGKSLKKVGKNAFTKLAKKATIKVPKSKKKAYTKLIKIGKGTTIK